MKKRLVFGITGLNLGGAERVLVDIANKLIEKYDITIFTLYGNGEFESQLDKKVKLLSVYDKRYSELNILSKKLLSLRLVDKNLRNEIYKKYIKDKFDVEIAFLEGPITWIFSCDGNAKKIAWVHNDIEDVFGKDKNSNKKQKMNEECYLKYNELVFVSQDNLNKFQRYFKSNKIPKRVIYNYLDCKLVIDKANKYEAKEIDNKKVSFVQVSRLVDQKAVLRLLDVHKKLIDDGVEHNIYLVGDGNLREQLEAKIEEYNVKDSFILIGKKDNPYPYIKKCDYFLLASYYEGYPMVLLEARALNKYIMITDSAARETLIDYENKLIVKNNEDGIYKGIKSLVKKTPLAKKSNKDTNKKILDEIINLVEGE